MLARRERVLLRNIRNVRGKRHEMTWVRAFTELISNAMPSRASL